MTTIDSLDIQISASVNKANASLTTLINRLDRVSASLSGVNTHGLATMGAGINKLSNAMSNFSANTKTADFSRLSRNLASISNIDTSKMSEISSNLSQLSASFRSFGAVPESAQQIGEFAKNISKLGNKGVQNAIASMPQLASAMRNLMQTLSAAPRVSQNVIQMTQALSNLAAQGGKVGTASRTMVTGINNTSNAMKRAKKSSVSLAAAFGKFYATWFLVIRGIKGFMKSVKSTTEYIESFNYYTVAFGKIASEFDKNWEQYGSDGARNYANAFVTEMNETLGKLSGVQVELSGDYTKGILIESGVKNLGLNIQEISQYASQLASITNSIGQTGEVSLAAAKSMTMLAGDISSLFNIDFQDVAQNLQSGLIGQSRALYKYGIDITNATLATYAYDLGLEKSVSEMTQAEKMQLRMLAILDQSKVSWGDLANTIQSPSNMLRQFRNNVKELSMVFGQLFIPVLQKVMPIINGVTIAIKRLTVSFANILGVKIDFDAFGQGYSDMGDGADDLSDSLDGVAASAKKAKAGLRAFDELKVINMPDTSAGGAGAGGDMIDLTQQILDATEEYEKAWNEAFAKMENTAQQWADKIEKILEPVKKIFEDFAIGDFFQAGKDVSALVVSITDFIARAIDNVDWFGIGQKIGKFLEGIDWIKIFASIGNLIWNAINAGIELWKGSFDSAPIETTILTAIGLLKWTGLGKSIFSGIKNSILKEFGAESGTSLGLAFLKWVKRGVMSIAMKIGLVFEGLFSGMKFTEAIAAAFGGSASAIEAVLTSIAGIGSIVGGVVLSVFNFVKMLIEGFDWLNEILMVVGTALAAVGAVILGAPAIIAGIVAAIVAGIGTIVVVIHDNWDAISAWFAGIAEWINNYVIQPVIGFFVGLGIRVSKVFEGLWIIIQAIWKVVADWFNTKVIQPVVGFFKPIVDKVSGFFSLAWDTAKKVWDTAYSWFKEKVIDPVSTAFEIACKVIGGFFSDLWKGVVNGLSSAINAVIGGIESAINFMIAGINGIIGGFNKVVQWAADVIGADWSGVDLVPNVSLGRVNVQAYAVGGFPEDGWFRASHGEIIGQFDNGQSVVANNYQITQGIADAVYPAVYNAVSSALKNNIGTNTSPEIRVFIGDKEITDVAIEGITERANRTGKMPFPVYA